MTDAKDSERIKLAIKKAKKERVTQEEIDWLESLLFAFLHGGGYRTLEGKKEELEESNFRDEWKIRECMAEIDCRKISIAKRKEWLSYWHKYFGR